MLQIIYIANCVKGLLLIFYGRYMKIMLSTFSIKKNVRIERVKPCIPLYFGKKKIK